MNRIEWTETGYGNGFRGRITIGDTQISIASVSYSVTRDDPDKPWILRTQVPGWTNDRRHATPDDAKRSAERILATFVTALRPDPTDAEIRQAAENAHDAVGGDDPFGSFLHGFVAGAKWTTVGR